jgi:hypothetical protein
MLALHGIGLINTVSRDWEILVATVMHKFRALCQGRKQRAESDSTPPRRPLKSMGTFLARCERSAATHTQSFRFRLSSRPFLAAFNVRLALASSVGLCISTPAYHPGGTSSTFDWQIESPTRLSFVFLSSSSYLGDWPQAKHGFPSWIPGRFVLHIAVLLLLPPTSLQHSVKFNFAAMPTA